MYSNITMKNMAAIIRTTRLLRSAELQIYKRKVLPSGYLYGDFVVSNPRATREERIQAVERFLQKNR